MEHIKYERLFWKVPSTMYLLLDHGTIGNIDRTYVA